jgi:2-polyprenyl-3-methyl-5-hydroxy-6-metoxy-1,4-benzoquinol methylase
LHRCRDCLLAFRHPRPDRHELDALYMAGVSDNWSAEEVPRPDWDLAAQWIAQSHPTGSVVDVGCFDGGFAARLGDGIERYGVEIHSEAAQRASDQHGVTMIGSSYVDLLDSSEQYDCIAAFDLIEHVHNPQELLTMLASRVRPGGSVIIGTGNADAPTWRFMGSRYWYSWFPEHISFVSPRWSERAAAESGLRVERVQRLSRSPGRFAFELAKNVFYRIFPESLTSAVRLRMLRSRGVESIPERDESPPVWVSSRDHFLVQFRKS